MLKSIKILTVIASLILIIFVTTRSLSERPEATEVYADFLNELFYRNKYFRPNRISPQKIKILNRFLHLSAVRAPSLWDKAKSNKEKLEKLCIFINYHNAMVVRILTLHRRTHYISALDIPDFENQSEFKQFNFSLAQKPVTLGFLKKLILSSNIEGIEFTLFTPSKTGTPLFSKPFTPDKLDEQINKRAFSTLVKSNNLRINEQTKTIFIPNIFRSFLEHHGKSMLNQFLDKAAISTLLNFNNYDIAYTLPNHIMEYR